jgi:hypothetical protein
MFPQRKIALLLFHSGFCLIQYLTKSELAEMPSCNLAKTVHNKWLQ